MSAQHPSRAVSAGYALTNLLLVLALAFAAFLLVDGAFGVARDGERLVSGRTLDDHVEVPPDRVQLPAGLRYSGWLPAVAGISVGLVFAAPARAQSAGKGFLFQEPRWTVAVRGGFERANASSDIFDFVTDTLTLDRSDFSGVNVSMDLAYSIKPQLDIALNVGYTGSKTPSEFNRTMLVTSPWSVRLLKAPPMRILPSGWMAVAPTKLPTTLVV